jgi:hypothetical protein
MTRTVTPHAAQPASQPKITHERIAMLAYEKWLQRGCPHGNDQQDWLEEEAELKSMLNRIEGTPVSRTTTAPMRPTAATPQPAPSTARRR